MEKIQRAAAVTSACEELIRKTEHILRAPRQINALGVYIDKFTVITNLQSARGRLDSAISVAESCREWPTSLDYGEV